MKIHCVLLGYELSYHSTFQFHTPNNVIPVNTENAVQVSKYASDTINLELTSFILDMDSDILTLTFNEPVQFFNIDCSGITLHNSTGDKASLTLSGCIFDSPQMIVALNLTRLS